MPVGYDNPRNLVALAGVGAAIYGFLNLSLTAALIGAAVLGWFAFFER